MHEPGAIARLFFFHGPFGPLFARIDARITLSMRTELPSFARPTTTSRSTDALPGAQLRVRIIPPFVQLAAARAKRELRIAVPARHDELARANRSLLKAMRAAELANWEKSGGDAWIRRTVAS